MTIVRWTFGVTLFLALLFLSLQNSDLVTVRFYNFFSWSAPLIFLLLIAFAAGIAAGLSAGLVRTARLKRQINRLRRDHAKHAGAPAAKPVQPADVA